MRPPPLSVLMSVRDGGEHLPPTMASLLGQSFGDFELVLVDDGSDAPTRAVIEQQRAADRRIRLLRNDVSQGLAAALNRGLAACRAPLVARADGDDLHHPERFARQVAAMRARPRLGAISCGFRRIDGAGGPIDVRPAVTGPGRIRFRMLFMNSLLHPGAMFRAAAVRALGGYDPAYWTAQDSDLWARLADVAELDNLPEPLVDYRIHDASIMRRRGEAGRRLSLSVPARLQARYLGRPLDEADVAATVALFQSFSPLESDAIPRGERGLDAIWRVAAAKESAAVLGDFRATVARSLARQARWSGRRAPAATAFALAKSVNWLFKGGGRSRLRRPNVRADS